MGERYFTGNGREVTEHIAHLEEENRQLKDIVKIMGSQIDELKMGKKAESTRKKSS